MSRRALRRYLDHPGITRNRHGAADVRVTCPACSTDYVMAVVPERMPRCENGCGPLRLVEEG